MPTTTSYTRPRSGAGDHPRQFILSIDFLKPRVNIIHSHSFLFPLSPIFFSISYYNIDEFRVVGLILSTQASGEKIIFIEVDGTRAQNLEHYKKMLHTLHQPHSAQCWDSTPLITGNNKNRAVIPTLLLDGHFC